jgi:hypothetical protein
MYADERISCPNLGRAMNNATTADRNAIDTCTSRLDIESESLRSVGWPDVDTYASVSPSRLPEGRCRLFY